MVTVTTDQKNYFKKMPTVYIYYMHFLLLELMPVQQEVNLYVSLKV